MEKINATVLRRRAVRALRSWLGWRQDHAASCGELVEPSKGFGYSSQKPARDFWLGAFTLSLSKGPERKCRDILFWPAGILRELGGLSLVLQAGVKNLFGL